MTGLEKLREVMAEYLSFRGVEAVAAWPAGARKRVSAPVAAVSLRDCSAGPSGFRDYLGEWLDMESGQWRELYGRRVRAVFGLDLYAPAELGEAACQRSFDRMASALEDGGPEGLRPLRFSRGQVSFDREAGLLHCPAEAECEAWLYAVADESGEFSDFMVKGELNGAFGA